MTWHNSKDIVILVEFIAEGTYGGANHSKQRATVRLNSQANVTHRFTFYKKSTDGYSPDATVVTLTPSSETYFKADIKNEIGHFVDKNGCTTKAYTLNLKDCYISSYTSGYNSNIFTMGEQGANTSGSGTSPYAKTIIFNFTRFLSNVDDFEKIYGFSVNLISK